MAPARLMGDWPLYFLYRIFSGLFGLLPEPVMRKAGEGVGRLAWRMAKDGGRSSNAICGASWAQMPMPNP